MITLFLLTDSIDRGNLVNFTLQNAGFGGGVLLCPSKTLLHDKILPVFEGLVTFQKVR